MADESIIFTDELTGIYNRRYLSQFLPKEIERAKKDHTNIWFFMMDLDNFKQINDSLGHLKGDEVLKATAEIIKRNLRGQDVLIRYAGDEFSAILPGGTLSDSLAVAKRLLESVEKASFNIGMHASQKLSISIGVSCFPDDATEALRLIDLADKALYVSKGKGKNHVSVVSDVQPEVLSVYQILERFPCPVFVGHEKQLAQIKSISDSVFKEKKARNVMLLGEAGVGKTRIIDEFVKNIIRDDVAVIRGHFSEKNAFSDYRTITDGLVKYFETFGFSEDLLSGIDLPYQQILSDFIPDLKKFISVKSEPVKNASEKDIARIFSQVLINISKKKSVCLILDDFHWIDKATLDIGRALKNSNYPILFVTAFNKEYANIKDKSLPISSFLNSKDIDFDSIEINSLSQDETAKMVLSIFKEFDSINDFSGLIYGVTKGNPLFIEEILKFFINRGFIFYRKGKWGWVDIRKEDIPKSIDDVVAERLKSLSPEIKEVIMQASVIGENFEVNLLQKLGKKNQGYVMGLIDSAKKSGLIKEGTKSDSFDFTSAKIRDVLYGLADNTSVKDLNRQIGQIKEELFKGNEKQIAGELYYHFKKAEDEKKASVYAQMVKEGKAFIYEKSINFAQNILKESEFDVRLLPDEALDLISDIVRLVYIAQINSGLYPRNSSMRTEPVMEAFTKINKIFSYSPSITLGRFNDFFIVNSKIFERPSLKQSFQESFTSFLKQHKIEKIIFNKGMTRQELEDFFEVFAASEKESLEKKFNQNNYQHIKLVFVTYEDFSMASKIKEREQLQDIMLIDYLMGKLPGSNIQNAGQLLGKIETHSEDIAAALTKIADQVSQEKGVDKNTARSEFLSDGFQRIARHIFSKGEGDWSKYKKGLAKTILSLEPDLRADVLRSEINSQPPQEEGLSGGVSQDENSVSSNRDIMKDILTEVPDDALVETIIHEYKDRKTSAADLKKIISKFVPDNQEKKEILLTKVNEALKNVNASEQEIKFLTTEENWQSLALSQKIDEFLTLSPERYSNISQQFGLKQFIEMAITSDNLKSSSVIEKFFIFFTDKDSAVRKVAGKDIFELVDVVFSGRKAEFFEVLFSGLISAFRTESEKEILDIVIAALEKLIFISLSAEDYKLFKNVFIEFNNLLVLEGLTKEKKEKIRELIKQLTSENILKRVIEKLLDFVDNNKDYSQISELLVVIGKPAVGYLIEEAMLEKNIGFVGYFAGYLRRKAVARILVQTEKEFVKDELKKKLMDNRWFIVRNTMDLIMHTEEPQLYPLFDLVKKHNDVRIRRKLTFILGRLNCKDSLNLCYELSADPDENVSLSALRIIGQLGDKASIEALSKIKLKGLPEEAKVAAIEDIKKRIGS